MKNRGILLLFLFSLITLMSINPVSAIFHYGGYSLSNLLNTFDSSTVILTSVFMISFVLIFIGLTKSFLRDYPTPAGVVAFALSFIFIFEINRRGYSFENIFYNIGISSDFLAFIIPILFLIIAIFFIRKFSFSSFLLTFGILLILMTIFTDIFYERGVTLGIGVVLLLIGGWLLMRKKGVGYAHYDWEKEKRQAAAIGRGAAWAGKKTWQGTGGKIIEQRQMEKAKKAERDRAQEEAYMINKQIKEIDKQIHALKGEIRKYERMKPSTPQEKVLFSQEILRLKEMIRQLHAKRTNFKNF